MQSMILFVAFFFKRVGNIYATCLYIHRIFLLTQLFEAGRAMDRVHIFAITELLILTMYTY